MTKLFEFKMWIVAFVFAVSFCYCGFADVANTSVLKKEVTTAKTQADKEKVNTAGNQQLSKEAIRIASEKKEAQQKIVKTMKELQNQRRELSLEIYKERVKLIKEDPDLQKLQKTIMDLHKKMALELNNNPKIKKLLADAKSVDDQMLELVKQLEQTKKKTN